MSGDWLHSTAIAIVGERNSGKTGLACAVLDKVHDRPVHVYKHPRPELVDERGWLNMSRLEQLLNLRNCVAWIDEPQIVIPKLDKRANEGLQRLLSIARHRDITLVFSTCDTRWITRALESFIDVWLVKDCEPALLKQGSLVKKIIKDNCLTDVSEFRLEQDEFLFYARKFEGLDGRKTFVLPEWWSEAWSKPFADYQFEGDVLAISDEPATKLRAAV